MTLLETYGYAGKLLRVELTGANILSEPLDEATLKKYIGGAPLGIKYLYDEVPPEVEWSDPENRICLFSGPLGGTRVGGSGTIAIVTKGPMTNGIASSQANGNFGAYLRFSGFDGVILEGSAPGWVYLYIHDGGTEIRDATHLLGKNTFDVEDTVRQELKKNEREISIMSIGPAGENLVRFACTVVDGGHVASHNGIGAVMGSKKLKAIVVERSKSPVSFKNSETLTRLAKEMLANALANKAYGTTHKEGTIAVYVGGSQRNNLAVKNYTATIHSIDPAKLSLYSTQNIREKFKAKPNPCWACTARHCHQMVITDGKYSGRVVEEPEVEGLAAFGSLTGIDDVTTTIVLNSEVDRLGLDLNESGWVIAWLMECYEKGILTEKDTDGLEMTWGNGEAIIAMLNKIAHRQGFGSTLAEGVMRAARHVGRKSPELAIYTLKGNSPRTHDHRTSWLELFDTCVSNTGTLETHVMAPYSLLGLPPVYDTFNPEVISTIEVKIKGVMLFEDSLGTCRFNTASALELICQAVNAATGWNMDVQEALVVGVRAANLARAFNLRHGISAKLDAPSTRYGSTPQDGIAAGRGIIPHWDKMLCNYYSLMGWDENGHPLPETLKNLGLDFVIPQLWP